jgi:pyruvate/2-oxoglutarate dehydrogenase complex dihydrolipoamide acyltransferase (E2) component
MDGTCRVFPKQRKIVLDICRAARTVPCFPVERTLQLAEVDRQRRELSTRISWCAIFVKAWAQVSVEFPELREVFISLPWMRLYRHPNSVASISIHRDDSACDGGELIWCRIASAESMPLSEIQAKLDEFQTAPIEQVFRDGVRSGKSPWLSRVLMWHVIMRWWGKRKAKKIGTFSVSTLSGENARNFFHPLIVTTSMEYGRVDPKTGECRFTLLCDHRVLDGMLAARAIRRLEEILQQQTVAELSATRSGAAEAA